MRGAAMRVHYSTSLDDAENRGSDSLPRPQQRLVAALMFDLSTNISPQSQFCVYHIGLHPFRSSCTLRN